MTHHPWPKLLAFYSLRALAVFSFAYLYLPTAYAGKASVYLGQIDDSDGIFKPTLGISGEMDHFSGSVFFWGRTVGVIKQRSLLSSGYRRYQPFELFPLQTRIGLTVAFESIEIHTGDTSEQEMSMNCGLLLGMEMPIYQWNNATFGLLWDSHLLFLKPGLMINGIVGRKVALGLKVSYLFGQSTSSSQDRSPPKPAKKREEGRANGNSLNGKKSERK